VALFVVGLVLLGNGRTLFLPSGG
jgi:hypothetical protein